MDGGRTLNLTQYLARVRQPVLFPPHASELDARDVGRWPLDPQRPWALKSRHTLPIVCWRVLLEERGERLLRLGRAHSDRELLHLEFHCLLELLA